jgi:hypothetical protein
MAASLRVRYDNAVQTREMSNNNQPEKPAGPPGVFKLIPIGAWFELPASAAEFPGQWQDGEIKKKQT